MGTWATSVITAQMSHHPSYNLSNRTTGLRRVAKTVSLVTVFPNPTPLIPG